MNSPPSASAKDGMWFTCEVQGIGESKRTRGGLGERDILEMSMKPASECSLKLLEPLDEDV